MIQRAMVLVVTLAALLRVPDDAVKMVPIIHPDLPWFEELGLKWHGLPAVSSMCLDGGGLTYTATPFSGWYTAWLRERSIMVWMTWASSRSATCCSSC